MATKLSTDASAPKRPAPLAAVASNKKHGSKEASDDDTVKHQKAESIQLPNKLTESPLLIKNPLTSVISRTTEKPRRPAEDDDSSYSGALSSPVKGGGALATQSHFS